MRAGRDLTREKFINALDSLYNYETGVTPPLTFGPTGESEPPAHISLLSTPQRKNSIYRLGSTLTEPRMNTDLLSG